MGRVAFHKPTQRTLGLGTSPWSYSCFRFGKICDVFASCYESLVFTCEKVGAGLRKFVVRTRDDKNSNSFHGVLGPLIYAFTVATSIAGFNALIPDQVVWRVIVSVG